MYFLVLLLPEPLADCILSRQCQLMMLITRWHRAFRIVKRNTTRRYEGPFGDWPLSDLQVWNATGKQGEVGGHIRRCHLFDAAALDDIDERGPVAVVVDVIDTINNGKRSLESASVSNTGKRKHS